MYVKKRNIVNFFKENKIILRNRNGFVCYYQI